MIGLAAFATQVVKTLVQFVPANSVFSQVHHLLEQKQLEKAIGRAVEQGTEAFINEQKHGQAPELLHTLERRGFFKKNSPIVPALAVLALNPTKSMSAVEQDLEQKMKAAVPDASNVQCKNLAKALITHVRLKVDAIPQMHDVQVLLYDRLNHEALIELLGKFAPPFPDRLREALLGDAVKAVKKHQHKQPTSAHLLYALTCRKDSAAHYALARVGITRDAAWEALAAIFERADHSITHPTNGVEHALLASRSIAGQNRASEVHEAHILEALLDEVENGDESGQSVLRMFAYLHTTSAAVRAALLQEMGENGNNTPVTVFQKPLPARPPWDVPTLMMPPADDPDHH